MVTTTFNAGDTDDWFNSLNWTDSVPGAGDTAIVPSVRAALADVLALANQTVDLQQQSLLKVGILTMTNSTLVGIAGAPPENVGVARLDADTLQIGKLAFIGANSRDGALAIDVTNIANQGQIGSTGPDTTTIIDGNDTGHGLLLSNDGQVNALNSGAVRFNSSDVIGQGSINLNNAGTVTFDSSRIAASQSINMGGSDSTQLNILGSTTLDASISGFGFTDLINFAPSGNLVITQNGAINPTLNISESFADGSAADYRLHFNGNFADRSFQIVDGSHLLVSA